MGPGHFFDSMCTSPKPQKCVLVHINFWTRFSRLIFFRKTYSYFLRNLVSITRGFNFYKSNQLSLVLDLLRTNLNIFFLLVFLNKESCFNVRYTHTANIYPREVFLNHSPPPKYRSQWAYPFYCLYLSQISEVSSFRHKKYKQPEKKMKCYLLVHKSLQSWFFSLSSL